MRTMRLAIADLIAVAALAGCGSKSGSPATPASDSSSTAGTPEEASPAKAAKAPAKSHTVVIVLENREFDEVIGAADAVYFNRLASRGALAVNYYATRHPSLPNYL